MEGASATLYSFQVHMGILDLLVMGSSMLLNLKVIGCGEKVIDT